MASVRYRILWRSIALTVTMVVLLMGSGKAADPPVLLPNSDYPKVKNYLLEGIKKALKDDSEENIRKARTASVILAAAAQQDLKGADGQLRATVRDEALKMAAALGKEKIKDALKIANAIPKLKPKASAKREPVKLLNVHIRFEDLMNQFDFPPRGGWGIDRDLYQLRLSMKSKVPIRDMNTKLMMHGYQVAMTAQVAHGKSKAKDWSKYTNDLQSGGAALAAAVKKKDGGAGMSAIAAITTSCSNCHKKYRKR